MYVYLVHHGDAVGPDVDPQRPLSAGGRASAGELARQAAERAVRPQVIWHSGKLRARQTAELFWQACNPLAEFAARRGLQPNDPPTIVGDAVAGETRDVMLVGHLPNLAGVRRLLRGDAPEGLDGFPLHGMVALERNGDRFVERWRLGQREAADR